MVDAVAERLTYPMRLVTKLTGLSSDTIRAWERRYGAIRPARTDGNTRQFSAEDVRRLTLLREATELGHAISAIAAVETENLQAMIAGGAANADAPLLGTISEAYLEAIRRFEARRAMELIRRAAATLEPREFVLQVALPIIRQVGERWADGELGVAHEHLVTAQMQALLHSIPIPYARQPRRILITTPPQHRHELGMVIGGILATMRGFEVIHLGSDLPYAELPWAVQHSKADVLLLSVVSGMNGEEVEELLHQVDAIAERIEVWIGCPRTHAIAEKKSKAKLFFEFESYDDALIRMGS